MKLEEIFTYENLYKAHKKCRLSKQHKGEVIRFEVNISENIYKIKKEILSKKYKISGYKQFIIYEPKKRLIEALSYKDRVILMCFCENCLIPRINSKLIYDNVAARKDKGTLFGIKRLETFLKKEFFKENNNNVYYLKCDIKKFFPSINRKILRNMLLKIGFSVDEMWYLDKVIGDYTDVGLPLGNLSSQWFALLYLNGLDRFIKEKLKVKCYVRYMDDFILVHRDKQFLKFCLYEIEIFCKNNLKLYLNEKTQIGKVKNGIDFLGFRHILLNNGKVIRKLRSSSKRRMKKHLIRLKKLKEKGIVDDEYVKTRKNSFRAHLSISHDKYMKDLVSK